MASDFPDLEDFTLTKTPSPDVVGEGPAHVGGTSLGDLSLEDELLAQYMRARRIARNAEADDGVPASQKAQTLNTVTSILSMIVKMQTELNTAERLKRLEAALMSTLKQQSPEIQTLFMEEYERLATIS